jgi:predicted PurR-regulated permease PerM
MTQFEPLMPGRDFTEKALNTIIRIGLIVGLGIWCYNILEPFVMIVLWGLIIAVSVFPLYRWMRKKLRNRGILAATIITLIVMLVLLVPIFLLGETLYNGIASMKGILEGKDSVIPPASESVKTWPLIGPSLYQFWSSAYDNLQAVILQYRPQITSFLMGFLSAAKGAGIGFLRFLAAIIVSGFFLGLSERGGKFAEELSLRLAGKRGSEFLRAAEITIRSVARGILGVALIQATLAGVGFLIAGVPAAGLWALIGLFLCIIQIGITPVLIGVVIYMFIHASTFTAIALLIWCIIIAILDNVLKPILLGRGSESPMLVIFLGAIGGFIHSGIIGLFTGAVVLSMGYNLFLIWMKELREEA